MNIGYNTPLHKSASRSDAKFGRKREVASLRDAG